jgi:asparagine synthetase B (glutamine-hydrolysing)
VSQLEQLLRDSLASRVLNIPDPPSQPGCSKDGAPTPARLAILFSGGLDCTVLARISHALLPASEPIDLLNVAFQNPRIHKASNTDAEAFEAALESCPDRVTGRASYAELCQVCPGRQWRFVAINVPYTVTMEHQDSIITLMHPHNTEMDLSIACALYFAARGTGMMCAGPGLEHSPYTTNARVLLSGLGADELFAGYTRHATAYNRHGHQGLIEELDLDIGRLGKRNLGRDDRVITNWGKEARFPFLDEKLVEWALAAPVSEKCDFGAPVLDDGDDGDLSAQLEPCKKVLRCLAWRLGMCKVASEKKRAVCAMYTHATDREFEADTNQIQFGARTAKMTTSKSKGTTPLS